MTDLRLNEIEKELDSLTKDEIVKLIIYYIDHLDNRANVQIKDKEYYNMELFGRIRKGEVNRLVNLISFTYGNK